MPHEAARRHLAGGRELREPAARLRHLDRTFIHESYACRRGKGVHAVVDRYQVWARRNAYALEMDVAKYFPSIDHQILKEKLRRRIKDARVSMSPFPGLAGTGAPNSTPGTATETVTSSAASTTATGSAEDRRGALPRGQCPWGRVYAQTSDVSSRGLRAVGKRIRGLACRRALTPPVSLSPTTGHF